MVALLSSQELLHHWATPPHDPDAFSVLPSAPVSPVSCPKVMVVSKYFFPTEKSESFYEMCIHFLLG
jgi:hypothetical protein